MAQNVNKCERVLAPAESHEHSVSVFNHFEVAHGRTHLALNLEWNLDQFLLGLPLLPTAFMVSKVGHEVRSLLLGFDSVRRRLIVLIVVLFDFFEVVLVEGLSNVLFVDVHFELASVVVLRLEVCRVVLLLRVAAQLFELLESAVLQVHQVGLDLRGKQPPNKLV